MMLIMYLLIPMSWSLLIILLHTAALNAFLTSIRIMALHKYFETAVHAVTWFMASIVDLFPNTELVYLKPLFLLQFLFHALPDKLRGLASPPWRFI